MNPKLSQALALSINRITEDQRKRFWSKVVKRDSGCWEWTGHIISRGYGQFSLHDKGYLAHRVAYALTFSTPDQSLYCCHRCDNPKCVNPHHIFLGTAQDNASDRVSKGRQARGERHGFVTKPESCPRGERCARSKYKEAVIRSIRDEWAAGGVRYSDLAEKFGMSHSNVMKVINRKTWTHLK